MKAYLIKLAVFIWVAGTCSLASLAALAQQDAGSARDEQVQQRIAKYQSTISKASADGKLTAKQVARDNKGITSLQGQLSRAQAKHHGHISQNDQIRIDRALDKQELNEQAQERSPSSMKTKRSKKH